MKRTPLGTKQLRSENCADTVTHCLIALDAWDGSGIKNPASSLRAGFFGIGEPDDVLLSHANAHYHWR